MPVRFSLGSTRVAILDSDYILNQIAEMVDNPTTGFMRMGPPFTRARAFASAHVLRELYQSDKLGYRNKWEKLADQAAQRGLHTKPADYHETFREAFMPHVTFVDVGDMFADAEVTKAVHASASIHVPLSLTRGHDDEPWR
jgi:hypothetical protein